MGWDGMGWGFGLYPELRALPLDSTPNMLLIALPYYMISLIRNCEKLPVQDHFIVQEYLDKPFLMEGYKFDLRFYILVTSCDPLRVFLYNDGLVRMGTEKYHMPNESNLNQLYMHLTNYSVNKHNENFERDETVDKGSKRSIGWFTEFLRTNDYDVAKFWGDVSELVVKTLIVAEPHVLHAYRMCRPGQPPGSASVCFEVLGFDIILDRKLKPWLLEINRAPSFGTDQKIDYDVKKGVLLNTLKLLNIRASDKRRNLARQKAEAQRRLYGQGSMRKLTAGSSEWEKQRHLLERRREELKERLAQVRKQVSRDEHEKRHLGNYRRIYPPDDKLLLEKYESLLSAAFQTFLAGRAASLQKEVNNPLKRMKEEDILDLLEQCELDDEKLMGKTSKQKGPKVLSSMPESSPTPRGHRDPEDSSPSCSDSSSASDADGEDESISITQEKLNRPERSSRVHWKPASKPIRGPSFSPNLSGLIRRSMSCPRSITSLTAQSPTNETRRPKTATHMTNASTATAQTAATMTQGEAPLSKEQEAALMQQTLAALGEMKIRYPGKSEEEAEAVLDEILNNWKYHKQKVASYWLVKLDAIKQRKVLDIVRSNIRLVLQRIWSEPDVESLRLYHLFNRVFNRLLWSHGQGLWNCLSSSGRSSWESVFSKSSEVVTTQERRCCQRVVQLCRDCLLVVYKFVADSRGSLSGLSPDWDDTRYLLPVTSQFIIKWPSSSFGRSMSSTRPRSAFPARMGHF
ncbi:tubulin polyglutamylase TTLL7-like isoform X3 [Cyprinus carpio]|uniref:Tubulin polyglutamylase TTLL7-like isoform X3 n=1 Tax=Cyprinus carpio TaxID=7962 RepID=A0A9Q9YKH8_CYPCA|nr:tubulin polyglutamylase TTLL7-like isoform X3 [Cyprinus carpio]